MLRWLSTILVLVLGFSPALSAEDDSSPKPMRDDPRVADAITAWEMWIEYQLAIERIPAASIGIVHDQDLLAARGFGFANPETGSPATVDTIYSICSISKLFTSVALMQLREEGEVRLDAPVSDYLDWFTLQDAHPDDEDITVRRLMSHSAGLPRESDYPYWSDPDFIFPTHDQIVDRLSAQQTLYPSSRYFQYSNLGLTLVGEIVVEVSGQDFDTRIHDEILDPLGMVNTSTDIPTEKWGQALAIGHTNLKRDGTRKPMAVFQANGIAPAAGFASTVPDLAEFAKWQFRLLSEDSTEIIRSSTLREMQRVQWMDPDWETTRGLGFGMWKSSGHVFVGHSGGCPGYYSQFLLVPKNNLGVIVLTSAIGSPVGFYAEKAADLLVPAIKAVEGSPDDAPERDPELDRYVGVYDSSWSQSAVFHWQGGLGIMGLGTRNPGEAIYKLKKTGDHTFRRVRKDDESLGEEFVFEVDEQGTVTRFSSHSNWMTKIRKLD
jgi:CubicO group peptidase (beta-lactamase class C family)